MSQMFVLFLDGGHILHSSTDGPSSSAAGRHVCLEKERALLSGISHPHWRIVFKYSHPYCFMYLFVQWDQKEHAWLLYSRSSQTGRVKGEDLGSRAGGQGPGRDQAHVITIKRRCNIRNSPPTVLELKAFEEVGTDRLDINMGRKRDRIPNRKNAFVLHVRHDNTLWLQSPAVKHMKLMPDFFGVIMQIPDS